MAKQIKIFWTECSMNTSLEQSERKNLEEMIKKK